MSLFARFSPAAIVAASIALLLNVQACSGGSGGGLFAPELHGSSDRGDGGGLDGGDASRADGGVCGTGQKVCGGECVGLDDPAFGCAGPTCEPCAASAGGSCVAGACSAAACGPDLADCDGNVANGCETNTKTSPQSCGTCGNACAPGDVCSAGTCQHSCANGLTTCGASCVDVSRSAENCGGCAKSCPGVANGSPTCSNFQCGVVCASGRHLCGGACVSNLDVATCGGACTPCTPPSNGTATCNGATCGQSCNAGTHACGADCVSNTSVTSCGTTSCTSCVPPANADSTCNGTSCGFQCRAGSHLCGGACASNTSVSTCGASCTPCATAPANATSLCTGTACDFACNPGWKRNGAACDASPLPTLALVGSVNGKVSGTFTLDPSQSLARLDAFSSCPSAPLNVGSLTSYQYVTITNPTAQTAVVSIWSSKAPTVGAVDIDTIMASYVTPPTTDAQRSACVKGVSDTCVGTGIDPTECLTQWAGLVKGSGTQVTLPPAGSITVYVAAYYTTTAVESHSGNYLLSVRTDGLQ